MGQYKVPQDVEAEDKLLGPFSFKQFIYLIIVAVGIGGMWGLFMILPPLAIIPLPIVLVFGALALPLRKDQPMEIYLAALVSYYIKPRRKYWQPDGRDHLIEVTVPKTVEPQRAKNITEDEADRRFNYLASLVDSHGWSVRGIDGEPIPGANAINENTYTEANNTQDVLDETGTVAQNFDQRLEQSTQQHRQQLISQMRAGMSAPAQVAQQPQQVDIVQQATNEPVANYSYTPSDPYASLAQQNQPAPEPVSASDFYANSENKSSNDEPQLQYNPYPTNMNQSVIQPSGQGYQTDPSYQQRQAEKEERLRLEHELQERKEAEARAKREQAAQKEQESLAAIQNAAAKGAGQQQEAPQAKESTSEKEPSPDIINLANNPDLSIATIAHEANRIHQKEEAKEEGEVFISLR